MICLYIKVNPQYLLQRLLKLQPPQQPQRLPLLVKSDLENSGLADAAGIDDGGGDVRPPQRLRDIELKSGKKLHFDRKCISKIVQCLDLPKNTKTKVF